MKRSSSAGLLRFFVVSISFCLIIVGINRTLVATCSKMERRNVDSNVHDRVQATAMVRQMLAVEFVLVLMNLEFVFVGVHQRSIDGQILTIEQKGKRASHGTCIDQYRRTPVLICNRREPKDGLIRQGESWYGNEAMLNVNRSTMRTGWGMMR